MPDPIPLSAADLRQAMRDPRYWQPGHPERAAYQAWVGDAFRQLEGDQGRPGDGLVWVNPYTRRRDGETEEVSGHFRHAGGSGARGGGGDAAASASVTVENDPGPGADRRYTARDQSGGLIGRCESLADGSQVCTLAMPDGGVVVQGLEAGDGEFVPVAAPAAAAYGFPALLGAAVGLYNHLQNRLRTTPRGRTAPDTPFMLFYRGFEGTEAGVQVTVGTLSEQRVNEFCPKTAEFEQRLSEIAAGIPREGLTPQQWGTAVHTAMHRRLRGQYGWTSTVVRTEFSLVDGRDRAYGTLGSSRLDIHHHVEGTSTICVYDVKTGPTALNANQAARIYRSAYSFAQQTGVLNPRVLIIELRRRP